MLYSPWLSSELEPGNTAQNAFARRANVIALKTRFTSVPQSFAFKLSANKFYDTKKTAKK
jgi:hypothetical protein